jgi:hypothetical protein
MCEYCYDYALDVRGFSGHARVYNCSGYSLVCRVTATTLLCVELQWVRPCVNSCSSYAPSVYSFKGYAPVANGLLVDLFV